MKTSASVRALAAALAATLLGACSTPAPVRELAGRGAATVGLAEASVRNYLAATKTQLESRAELLRSTEETFRREQLQREFDAAILRTAGVSSRESSEKLIRDLAEVRRQFREKEEQALAEITAGTKFDSSSLVQVPVEKLSNAKKRFVALSQELTAEDWIRLVGGYARLISDGLEDLKNKKGDEP
jgi:predicted transcriptional regulator